MKCIAKTITNTNEEQHNSDGTTNLPFVPRRRTSGGPGVHLMLYVTLLSTIHILFFSVHGHLHLNIAALSIRVLIKPGIRATVYLLKRKNITIIQLQYLTSYHIHLRNKKNLLFWKTSSLLDPLSQPLDLKWKRWSLVFIRFCPDKEPFLRTCEFINTAPQIQSPRVF